MVVRNSQDGVEARLDGNSATPRLCVSGILFVFNGAICAEHSTVGSVVDPNQRRLANNFGG